MPAIEIRELRKSYGSFEAVRGIDLTVDEGEVFALLGPNGAGKTTTVEILEGFRPATSGTVRVLGVDPARGGTAFRKQVGIVLQEAAVEPFLTVREVLERNAGYYDDPLPVPEVIERVGLSEKADSRIKTLSGGQHRRLDVGLGIVGRPRLLFLDEPTTGFDPSARRSAWELVASLREVGTTIVLTTHYMDEAQALADRLAVLARGVVVASGTIDDIGGRNAAATRIRFVPPPGIRTDELPVRIGFDNRGRATLETTEPTRVLYELTRWATDRGLELEGLHVQKPTLEDIYLALTREAEEAAEGDASPAQGHRTAVA